ncbi:MAG: hypothetical protein ACK4K4_01445 [Caldimicrobium sp.]
MQITAPTPIFYLPENLWSLFTRPGRELTIRVLQIEGKLLYLDLGGYKFQARLGGTLNPEDLKVGDLIRVRVLKSEGPIVLQVISSEKEEIPSRLLYLLVKEKPSFEGVSSKVLNKELSLFTEILRGIVERKGEKVKEIKNLEELLGKDIKFLPPHLEEEVIFFPFIFQDEKSWGYLEIKPEEKGEKIRIFTLKIFFQYLGLVEAYFSYSDRTLEVDLYFTEREALEFAKDFFKELKDSLHLPQKGVIIKLEKRDIKPGYVLERVG